MSKLFDKFKNMPAEEIMKVKDVKLLETSDAKRITEEEFEFTFTTNGITDPEWRDIFKKHFGSEKFKFHGSKFTLTCKPTDLNSTLSQVKLSIISTNNNYKEKRENLIEKINAKNEEAKISAINKNIEEDEVKKMFNDLKV